MPTIVTNDNIDLSDDTQLINECETDNLNELAGHFYRLWGREIPECYDFESSTHPDERNMYELAVIAFNYFRRYYDKR